MQKSILHELNSEN